MVQHETMEEADAEQTNNIKKPPRVPIQTYHWEDVRKSRRKGGYPWTYLDRPPFDEEAHPEHYTMEEFRRSRSSSTLGKTDALEIHELPNGSSSERGSVEPIISEATTPEPTQINRARDSSIVTLESAGSSDNISQYLDKDEKDRDENISAEQTNTAVANENKENVNPTNTALLGQLDTNGRNERAKSEEPKRKRKLSIESSYSRISLSKLGVLKKLRDAKEKIKVPKLSFRRKSPKKKTNEKDKKEKEEKEEENKPVEKAKNTTKARPTNPDKPVYIHIPLKPPPGETDEFSYLEFGEEAISQPSTSKEPDELQSTPDSPAPAAGVQFIVLTPPSDDEILEDAHIPDTPSEGGKFFDNVRIEDLKTLAKDVVDGMEARNKKLATVEEDKENGNAVDNLEEGALKEQPTNTEEKGDKNGETGEYVSTEKTEKSDEIKKQEEKMVIDEEDGLRSSEVVKTEVIQEVSSTEKPENVSPNTTSQVAEKRRSFRKKAKNEDADRIYEDVQVPQPISNPVPSPEKAANLQPSDVSQSMSVDEEKTYLDEKIIKTTSLEEDYNKWSKTNDHEYEPVNPPPDGTSHALPPLVHVTDTDLEISRPVGSHISSTTSLERRMLSDLEQANDQSYTAQDLQDKIDERYFDTTPETTDSRTDCEVHTSQVDSSAIEDLPLKRDSRKGKKAVPGQSKQGKFQQAIRNQAGKFKTQMQKIKKPNISLPARPKFEKFTIEKPKLNLPKIPDTTVIHLPTFSLTRKRTKEKTLRQRQCSTESNDGDSKKPLFDFSTYPRIFKKKKPKDDVGSLSSKDLDPTPPVEFATVPRTAAKRESLSLKWAHKFSRNSNETPKKTKSNDRWGGSDSIRIPLHPEDSVEKQENEISSIDNDEEISHTRFNEDIDATDAYEQENQEIHRVSPFSSNFNSRWNHGTFHGEPPEYDEEFRQQNYTVTDLDNDLPEPQTPPSDSYEINAAKEAHSSSSSFGLHQRGVLEEINSDEFFLRQKGISQDNIDVGMYLSSEIREAFTSPANALSQMENRRYYDQEYDIDASNHSLQEKKEKRPPIKKPKRKKTPHVSHEQMNPEVEFEANEPNEYPKMLPPARPSRKNKKEKNSKAKVNKNENIIPYQETIPLNSEENLDTFEQNGSDLKYFDEIDAEEYPEMYENEQMEGKDQPAIQITDPYSENVMKATMYENTRELNAEENSKPAPPPRKHKSLKSLSYSEHDSIIDDIGDIIQRYNDDETIPNTDEPPPRPDRTRSQSRGTSQPDDDRTSRGAESLMSENQGVCLEEPCIKDIRDPMGYAIIDKQKMRDPPLPPPRTPPRRRRSIRSDKSSSSEAKFSTVPRTREDSQPIRPLRNYSTLGPSRPPRNKSIPNLTDEEKENIDITQYIEIEEDPARRLQSGEIIQKMRDRPLPAPPRPPRRGRPFQDITQEENMPTGSQDLSDKPEQLEETEVSTQTDPLLDDFECEEVVETNPRAKRSTENQNPRQAHLETPTQYSYEETVTHGSLIVEPLNGAQLIPESQFSRIEKPKERIIPVHYDKAASDDETSEVPEEFHRLSDPLSPANFKTPQQLPISIDVQHDNPSLLKAERLEIHDLDVNRLTVNELLANKITVSEIDGITIHANEISSKSGALKINQIELPQNIIQQILEKLQISREQSASDEVVTSTLLVSDNPNAESNADEVTQQPQNAEAGQKKTPMKQSEDLVVDEPPPQRPPRQNGFNKTDDLAPQTNDNIASNTSDDELVQQSPEFDSQSEAQLPPPESGNLAQTKAEEVQGIEAGGAASPQEEPSSYQMLEGKPPTPDETQATQELEVDDEAPPRPPRPASDYVPSQPPASFYALRAQKYTEYLDDDIPLPPRRRRHQKVTVSKSSSDETPPGPVVVSRRRLRTPEPSIPQLTGQLVRACGTATDRCIKRLISHITDNVLHNSDGQQDMHVMIVILLVLIAGLILLGFGEGRTTIHHHHWEFFFPPQDR